MNLSEQFSKDIITPLANMLKENAITQPFGEQISTIGEGIQKAIDSIKKNEVFKLLEDLLNPLILVFNGLISNLPRLIMGFEAIQKVLDPINTAFDKFAEIVTPILNEVLSPLIGVWRALGDVIGKLFIPILKLLQPLIILISQLMIAGINMLVPVFRAIYDFFATIANAVISVYNWIASALNALLIIFGVSLPQINNVPSSTDLLNNYSLAQVSWEGANAISGGNTGAGTTSMAQNVSYTMYIEINFNDAVVADTDKLVDIIREKLSQAAFSVGKI